MNNRTIYRMLTLFMGVLCAVGVAQGRGSLQVAGGGVGLVDNQPNRHPEVVAVDNQPNRHPEVVAVDYQQERAPMVAAVMGVSVRYVYTNPCTKKTQIYELYANKQGQSVRYTIETFSYGAEDDSSPPKMAMTSGELATSEVLVMDHNNNTFSLGSTDENGVITKGRETKFSTIADVADSRVVMIDGWECKVVSRKFKGRSYTIYYTTNLGFTATPFPELGMPNGLVLRIENKGVRIYDAQSVNQLVNVGKLF